MTKTMKTMRHALATFAAAATVASVADAAVLKLTPSVQSAEPGDMISIALEATGLTAGGPLSIGAVDIDLLFDDGALAFSGWTLEDGLGLIPGFDSLDLSFGLVAPGVVDFSAVSFLSAADLDAYQGATALLATFDFQVLALADGTDTIVSIDEFDPFLYVADGDGFPVFDLAFQSARVRNPSDTAVSEPAPLLFLALGLGLMGVVARARRAA